MADFDKFAWLKAIYREPHFTLGEKAVLAHIAVFNVLNGRDSFCVRQSTIAAQCRTSDRTVAAAIGAAKRCGYLIMSRRRATGYGRSGADELRLALPAVSEESSPHSDQHPPAVTEESSLHSGRDASDMKQMAESPEANSQSDMKQMAESPEAPNSPTSQNDTPNSSGKQFSENSSGGRGAHARSTPAPEVTSDEKILDAEIVDDAEPPRFCAEHAANPGAPCRTCRHLGQQHDAWQSRKNAAVVFAIGGHQQADEPANPGYSCPWCHDGGIVLNSDGTPGRHIRICHHDHSWHIATPEELAELEDAAS